MRMRKRWAMQNFVFLVMQRITETEQYYYKTNALIAAYNNSLQ